MPAAISIVTPTLRRPDEVRDLLANLCAQSILPSELILVDGAPAGEDATEAVVRAAAADLRYAVRYIRRSGGTAVQRNVGIDQATGDFVALVDDDIRLEPDFLERMMEAFTQDSAVQVGGIAGYITNQHLDGNRSSRWRWYRRLKLFTTYEPGRFDYQTGYPINRYLEPPHERLKPLDFMGAGCAVWRRQVFDDGLRFSPFFSDYGMIEDAHFALRARRKWQLLENGRARCIHLMSQTARPASRALSRKTAVNYRFLFVDIVPDRTWKQELRFWRVQAFDLMRLTLHAVRKPTRSNWMSALGKAEGIVAAARLKPMPPTARPQWIPQDGTSR